MSAIPRPGATILRNVQPLFAELKCRAFFRGSAIMANLTNGLTHCAANTSWRNGRHDAIHHRYRR